MVSTRLTTVLAAATLTVTLTGCGTDDQPEVNNQPPEQASASAGAPADPAPSTEAPTDDEAPTSEAADPTGETPQEDLPTEPTAYGDAFVQAWVDQDQELLEQLAGPDVLANMETWNGQGWTQVDVIEEEHNALIIQYTDEQNLELEIWVQGAIAEKGEPHGVVSASVTEGPYPIPDTVKDYATAFVNAAGGDAEDREYLERLSTPEAAAEAQDWVSDFVWGVPEVSDGPDANTARVTFPGDSDVELVVLVDIELAESASEDAVLSAQLDGGLPEMSIQEYADEFVRAFGEGDAQAMGYYATDEVVDKLRDDGGPGWVHARSEEDDGAAREIYQETETGRELVLAIDAEMVAARDYRAITGADLSGGE